MPVRLQINFFPERFRDGDPTECTVIDKDGRTVKHTIHGSSESGQTRTDVEDLAQCRQIDVLNRTERQSPINSPVYVCNLMQIFNWVKNTEVNVADKYNENRYDENRVAENHDEDYNDNHDDNYYEIVDTGQNEPLDFYAEMFDTGLNELYESNGSETMCRTLIPPNRHLLFPYFWKRGGTIVGITDKSILNFRRRVQQIRTTDNSTEYEPSVTKMCTIDMLTCIDNQLGQQPGLIDREDDFRRYELTLSNATKNRLTALRPENGRKGKLQISAFTDITDDTPAAFLPWETMPYVQLRLRLDRLDGEASLVHRKQKRNSNYAAIFWPRRTVLRQAESFLGIIAELFYLTDDTAHMLRFGEITGRIDDHNYSFTKLIDRFAHDQLDPVLLKLIGNRSIVARVNEDCVTNRNNPRSITLYLTSVAGRIVRDRGENDTQNQVWSSMNQQNAIGGITYLGQVNTGEKPVNTFAVFACSRIVGSKVRCVPYRPSAKRFYDKVRIKLHKYNKFDEKIDAQIVGQLAPESNVGRFRKFTMTNNRQASESCTISYFDLGSRRVADVKSSGENATTTVVEITEPAVRSRAENAVRCLLIFDRPAENRLLRSTVQLARDRLVGRQQHTQRDPSVTSTMSNSKTTNSKTCFVERTEMKKMKEAPKRDQGTRDQGAYFSKFAETVESIVQLVASRAERSLGEDCNTQRNELCSNARQLRTTQRSFERLVSRLSTVERGEEQFSVTKSEIISTVQNMLRIIIDTSELLLKSGDHYSHQQLTILLDNVSR